MNAPTLHLDLSTPQRMARFERVMTVAAAENPPSAFMGVQGEMATVCAWCPTKVDADIWCKARGWQVSHGCCPSCFDKQMAQ